MGVTGKGARQKGHGFERTIANDLIPILGNAKRGFQFRESDATPDIECPVFHIEAKAHKKSPLRAALKQAEQTCKTKKIPIAICKDDYQEPIVLMSYSNFKKLISMLKPEYINILEESANTNELDK